LAERRPDSAAPAPSWHEGALAALARRSDAQALLLRGPEGIGKRRLALALAREWVSGGAQEGRRYFDSESHPDFLAVMPEPRKEDTRTDILVEQVRDLLPFCSHTPAISDVRVAVIYPACRMNRSASGALLKLLEEPPRAARLILAAHNPERLPATILSRCQVERAPVPSREESQAWLESAGIEAPAVARDLYGRAPFRLLELEGLGLLEDLVKFLASPTAGGFVDLAAALGKEKPIEWPGWILKWVCDLAAVSLGNPPAHYLRHEGQLRRIAGAQGASGKVWLDLQQRCAWLGHVAQAKPNSRMLAERMLGAYMLCARR